MAWKARRIAEYLPMQLLKNLLFPLPYFTASLLTAFAL
jgi:hypothetical protein